MKCEHKAEVTKRAPLTMQVCVPNKWTKKQIEEFANISILSGTQNGWMIVNKNDRCLDGAPLRVKCEDKKGFIHTILGV